MDNYSQQYMGWHPHGFFPHFQGFRDYTQLQNSSTSTNPNMSPPNMGQYGMPPAIDGPFQPPFDSQMQSAADTERPLPPSLDGQIDSPKSNAEEQEFETFPEVCKLPTTEMSSSKFFLEPEERLNPGPMRPRGKEKRSKLSKENKSDEVNPDSLQGPQPPMTPILGNNIWTPQTPDHDVLQTSSPPRKKKDDKADSE